jgi:drug/metabolite transporter (DMT)-like permease
VSAVLLASGSRSGVIVGTAPLVSVLIALTLLHESFQPIVAVGAALIVSGGIALSWERSRPAGFKAIGLAFAAVVAVLFAVRDNVIRATTDGGGVPPTQATAITLGAAAVVVSFILAFDMGGSVRGGQLLGALRAFAPAGLLFGVAYIALVAAFDTGSVAVVSPLNATQSLWAIVFSAALLGRADAVGPRVMVAGVCVVLGAATIGLTR